LNKKQKIPDGEEEAVTSSPLRNFGEIKKNTQIIPGGKEEEVVTVKSVASQSEFQDRDIAFNQVL
jgi:hypothetical protein